jgi:ATP-dependent helicase/nuclease subunit B
MTIRFILGRAGSGKTEHCLRTIARISKEEPLGPPIIFLVPEQATFQMERELAALCGGGTFRAQVLSFRRLAHRVLQEGKPYPPLISELGRQMVLRRLLQENAQQLVVLSRAARQPRFCLQLSAQIRELNNYRVSPADLQALAQSPDCPGGLRGKLQDLSTVAAAYGTYTKGRFTDPENTLELLAAALDEGALPAGTQVWVDGFAGLTQQEFLVLGALFRATKRTEVALCLDPTQGGYDPAEDDLFHPTKDTYLRLRRLAGEIKVRALPALHLPEDLEYTRFINCVALGHLEDQFGCIPGEPYAKNAPEIKLCTAAGPRAEVEAAVRDILRLVQEKGWRYRHIGIVLRDMVRYHDLLAAVLLEYNIPFFMDERRSAAHHPLVELLRSALEAALSNMSAAPMIQMLKTDLLPLSRLEADRLENYVRAHGIRGMRWLDGKPWSFRLRLALDDEGDEERAEADDHNQINQARAVFAAHFAPFFKDVAGSGIRDAVFFCQAIWSFLERLDVSGQLQAWTEDAATHRQVWQGVVSILDQTGSILAGQQMGLQEFTQVFLVGLESLTLGLVPAGLDQVVVGSVERSRRSSLRAVYVLGLCEGDFPARLSEEGLFADEERETLGENGVELAVTRRQRLFHEQYLSYIALTRSSDYLWAGCPLADEEGKAKRPSTLFNRLRELFPHNEVTFAANTAEGEDYTGLHGEPLKTAAALLLQAGRLVRGGVMSPYWGAVYNEALEDTEVFAGMHALWPALRETNIISDLTSALIEPLYGTPLQSSVSRLEQFARCPFAHTARYGLRLQERAEYRVEAPDMGNFYHAALNIFTRQLLVEKLSWASLTDDDVRCRMEAVVDHLIPRLRGEILMSTARLRYLAVTLKEVLVAAATALTEHARQSLFAPVSVEMPFGTEGVPAWQLTSGDTRLYGRIDRVDMAVDEDQLYLRVIDYKTAPQDLKLGDVWHGLSLQLLAYLSVVIKNSERFGEKNAIGAGAFYFGIEQAYERVPNPPPKEMVQRQTPPLDGLSLADTEVIERMGGPTMIRRAAAKKDGTFHKAARVVRAEQLDGLLAWLDRKMAGLAEEILDGRAAANPFKKANGHRACQFCSYLSLCRFDVTISGNSYKNITALSHEEVLTALAEEGGDSHG